MNALLQIPSLPDLNELSSTIDTENYEEILDDKYAHLIFSSQPISVSMPDRIFFFEWEHSVSSLNQEFRKGEILNHSYFLTTCYRSDTENIVVEKNLNTLKDFLDSLDKFPFVEESQIKPNDKSIEMAKRFLTSLGYSFRSPKNIFHLSEGGLLFTFRYKNEALLVEIDNDGDVILIHNDINLKKSLSVKQVDGVSAARREVGNFLSGNGLS